MGIDIWLQEFGARVEYYCLKGEHWYASFRAYILAAPNSLRWMGGMWQSLWSQFLVYSTFSGQCGGFGFKAKLLVVKVLNPHIAQDLVLYSNNTSIYIILLAGWPHTGRENLEC